MNRLLRPRTDRMIGGVCGGLGAYFGIDPVIVRLVFVVLALFHGISLVLYPILWVLMPNAPAQADLPPDARYDPQTGLPLQRPPAPSIVPVGATAPAHRHRNLAVILMGLGTVILASSLGDVFHVDINGVALPLMLVGLGIYLLRGQRTH